MDAAKQYMIHLIAEIFEKLNEAPQIRRVIVQFSEPRITPNLVFTVTPGNIVTVEMDGRFLSRFPLPHPIPSDWSEWAHGILENNEAAKALTEALVALGVFSFDGQMTTVHAPWVSPPPSFTWQLLGNGNSTIPDLNSVGTVIFGSHQLRFRDLVPPIEFLPISLYSSSSSNSGGSWEQPPQGAYEYQPRRGNRSHIGRNSAIPTGKSFSFHSKHFTGQGSDVKLKNGILLNDINLQNTANSGPAVYLHKSTATENGVTRHGRDTSGLLTTLPSLRRVHGRHPYTREPFGHSDVRRISQNALREAVEAEIERRRRQRRRKRNSSSSSSSSPSSSKRQKRSP